MSRQPRASATKQVVSGTASQAYLQAVPQCSSTKLMKQLGYGAGYAYDHDQADGFSGQNYFPDSMARDEFYAPKDRGFERELAKRQAYWAKLRAEKDGS